MPRLASVAEVQRLWRLTVAIGLVGTTVTVAVALGMGDVRFDPRLPPGALAFLLSLTHFTLNATHVVLFSAPLLAR